MTKNKKNVMKNKKAGIATLFEIIGASVFLLLLFVIFCSGMWLGFDRSNIIVSGKTGGYYHDITMQSYLRTPVIYTNEEIDMLELIDIAIDMNDFAYLEQKTKELLIQYVYDSKFWYVAVWEVHPDDLGDLLDEYIDYDDFEDMIDMDIGDTSGNSKLLVNMHQLEPKDKGENVELKFTQIPYVDENTGKIRILIFQVGDAK